MSVVIIGGNERMERRYKDLCEQYKCKAKVYTKKLGDMRRIGCPDLLVLFTGTMSHKMLYSAAEQTKKRNIRVAHSPTASVTALRSILDTHIEGRACNV